MYELFRKYRTSLVSALTLLVLVLVCLNLRKYGYLDIAYLAGLKDAAATLNSILTMIVLSVGSYYSYYRFFRGRTFSERAEVIVKVTVHDTPEDITLHGVTVEVKNLGSTAIWKPRVTVTLKSYGFAEYDYTSTYDMLGSSTTPGAQSKGIPLIDSAEVVSFYDLRKIPKKVWAVSGWPKIT